MTHIVKNTVSIKFYNLNNLYRKLKNEAIQIEKDILDLEILKLKKEKRLLEVNEQLRKIESEILIDIERNKCL